GFDGQPRTGNQGNDQITEVGDGGIAQQALEVALHQRQEVAEQDGGNGDTCQQVVQPAATGGRRYLIQTHQHGKYGDLGSGGQKGRDRRRSTLIHVGRPQVEGHQREFECQPDQHHAEAQLQYRSERQGTQLGEGQTAGFGVGQGNAEQQEG